MTPHETGSTTTPGAPRATAPLTRTFSSDPRAPLAAGPPISPPSSVAPRGPPR